MTSTQMWLALGLPTFAVVIGTLVIAFVFSSLSPRLASLEARMVGLISRLDAGLSAMH